MFFMLKGSDSQTEKHMTFFFFLKKPSKKKHLSFCIHSTVQQNTQWFAFRDCCPWQGKRFNSEQSDLQQQRSGRVHFVQWESCGQVCVPTQMCQFSGKEKNKMKLQNKIDQLFVLSYQCFFKLTYRSQTVQQTLEFKTLNTGK